MWCRCDAAKFKQRAAGKIGPLELRTHASNAIDLETYDGQTSKKNIEGVSGVTLIPPGIAFDHIPPPPLHVCGLGPTNDRVNDLFADAMFLDNRDPSKLAAAAAAAEELEEMVDIRDDQVPRLQDVLGDDAVQKFLVSPTSGAAEENDAEMDEYDYGGLLRLAAEEAQKKSLEALHIESGARWSEGEGGGRSSDGRSGRMKTKDAREAQALAKQAEALEDISVRLEAAIDEIGRLEGLVAPPVSEDGESSGGGKIVAALRCALRKHQIDQQKHWNNTLVGGDCRKTLVHQEDIVLTVVAEIKASGYPEAEAEEFQTKHCALLKPLAFISELTRRATGILNDEEIELLDKNIKEYVKARREYPGNKKILTPKEHVLEDHVMYYVRKYKTLGIFGEDGLEALHPKDTRKRHLTRCMRNPEARVKAHMNHMNAMMRVKKTKRTKGKRRYFGARP